MKIPISPPPSEAGFTLIELLVVMTILGLVAGFAANGMARGPDRFSRQQAALKLEAAILKAADGARLSGTAVMLRPFETVPGASLAASAFPAQALVLHPDGSASGGTVVLDGQPLLTVDWLTGSIARAR